MEGDIEILAGASLQIKCRVSMPQGSKITVHPGGKLVLDDCVIHNDCGHTWKGIEVMQRGKLTGEVIKIGNPALTNLESIPSVGSE